MWHVAKKIWSGSHLDVYPHALRHSYAIVRHVDIPPLQLLLWQAGIQTSIVYLQFNNADLRQLYDKYNKRV